MAEKNMALLSQSEIDTLIAFLNQKKGEETLKSESLSQNSINKLIDLIKSTPSITKHIPINQSALEKDFSSFFASSESSDPSSYELTFKLKDGLVKLYACNVDSVDVIDITPSSLITEQSVDTGWGRCIAPTTFCFIAKRLNIRFSEETLEDVKKLFAEVMYGDENTPIPDFYLP